MAATFGSFQSASVEELIAIPDAVYQHPTYHFLLPDISSLSVSDFGTDSIKRAAFCIEPSWTFINHGAFGGVFAPALDVSQQWSRRMESQPLRFFDRELLPLLVDSTRYLASFIGCSPSNIVLTPNVTTGLNAIFKSLCCTLQPEDLILRLDLAYGSVKKILVHYWPPMNGKSRVIEVVIPIPAKKTQILELVAAALDQHRGRIKIAVFDHITSNSAILIPVMELISMCREQNITTVIDGAHALGALDLNLALIDADFYVSNSHKWLCNPKGCAFLYVATKYQQLIKPLIISHGSGVGFLSDFVWTGSQDYCSMLTLPFVISIWKHLGPERIRSYITELLSWSIELFLREWKTELLADRDMFVTMATIRLPGAALASHPDEHNIIQNILFEKYQIEAPIKRFNDRLYVRISVHIYNKRSDYERLKDAMLEIRSVMLPSAL